MASLNNHGREVVRYLAKNGALCSVREDGTTLVQTVHDRTWRPMMRKKAEVALEVWRAGKIAKWQDMPSWRRNVKSLPSMRALKEWVDEGTCETPTGDVVEPDGTGPDGVPSWLLALGLV